MILGQPLSFLFQTGINVRNRLYDRGTLQARELQGPVVSIGNISVGGSGKTPFTILLGEMLKARGISFDILSRGYRRSTTGVAIVDPNGSAREFGDEPLLMSRRLHIPVVVGADRYEAGVLAEKTHGVRLHLLDDGFQHRRLKRQFDVVLVTPDDFRDRLLPGGRLREPLSALARADATVLAGGASVEPLPVRTTRVWRVQRAIVGFEPPSRPLVFCGIARPQQFLTQLRSLEIEPAGVEIYRDHHAYSDADVRHLLRVRDRKQATGLITTEKDAINLGPLVQQLEPVAIAQVEMTLDNAGQFLDYMLETLKERGKPAA